MDLTLTDIVEKYNLPKAWLAELCGFKRTQLANWVLYPDKYPIPPENKAILEGKLRELGAFLKDVELL